MIYNYFHKINLMKILEEFIKRHLKKSKKRIYQYNYRQDNKEKIKEVDKINYRKNKEKKKIQNKVWRENNKEKRKKLYEDWYSKNNIKKNSYNKKWRENNQDYIVDWNKTNHNKLMISKWKRMGVISNNYDLLFDKWKNTKNCENCNVELTDGNLLNTKRVLDHSHLTGEFRNILCHLCNIRRGETNI